MKKYPKLVQCDKRGQIVIPKDMREELGIDESSGFWMFSISKEGILLKLVDSPEINTESGVLKEVSEKAEKLGIKRERVEKTVKEYEKKKRGKLEEI